jgi:hypothetical protein
MQPFTDRARGDCPAGFIPVIQRSAVMIAAHANVSLVGRTDMGKNVGDG